MDLEAPPVLILFLAMLAWLVASVAVAVQAHRATEGVAAPEPLGTVRAARLALAALAAALASIVALAWTVGSGEASWTTPALGTAAGVIVAAGITAVLENPIALGRMARLAPTLDPDANQDAFDAADDARYVVRRSSWFARGEAVLLGVALVVVATQPTWA